MILNWRLILDYAELDEVCCVGVTRVDNIAAQHTMTNPVPTFGTDFSIFLLGGTDIHRFPVSGRAIPGRSCAALPVCAIRSASRVFCPMVSRAGYSLVARSFRAWASMI